MLQPKVILDVDPGIDDAVAVIAALKSSRGRPKFKENNISGNIQVAIGLDKL